MPDHLGPYLDALADHAARAGRLDPAEAVRARADRRRRRRHATTGALGVALAGALATGIAMAQPSPTSGPPADSATIPPPAVSSPGRPSTTPPSFPSSSSPPSSSSSPSGTAATRPSSSRSSSAAAPPRVDDNDSGVFSGSRQVRLLPANSEATFAVAADDRIVLSEAFDNRSLFVLKPMGDDRYRIMTATIRVGGESSCLEVQDGTPAEVIATGCDASQADQLFRFRNTGTAEGKPKYTIYTGTDTYLVQDPTGDLGSNGGVIATRIGEGTPDIDTPFFLPDVGEANLPTLD